MDRNRHVYIEQREVYRYPNKRFCFSPSQPYPEYPFPDSVADEPNEVYDMVRACLRALGLDEERYGTPEWNPLGEIIHPGDRVVLKPNMVMHKHSENLSLGTECVITHPSIVRAVADYCVIAMQGKGILTIGDAPLQSCDFEKLTRDSGYLDMVSFYSKRSIAVGLKDFRRERSKKRKKMGVTMIDNVENNYGDPSGYVAVDIGKDSMLDEKISQFEKFRVTSYIPDRMKSHHNPEKNEYLIPRTILDADVIVNLPKPKTHRKAGMTAVMKNLVGINGQKDWLPHHTCGSLQEGGDEYKNQSLLKRMRTKATEKADIAGINGHSGAAIFWGLARKAFTILVKDFNKDIYAEGSWYGNDTIWRTLCDLNRILIYADKTGKLQQTPQRRCIAISDMVISGEGEGPLEPTPKEVGMIAAGWNPLTSDTALCALMGLDWRKIPSVCRAYDIQKYPLAECAPEEVRMISNSPRWQDKAAVEISRAQSLGYHPSKGWKDHIETDF